MVTIRGSCTLPPLPSPRPLSPLPLSCATSTHEIHPLIASATADVGNRKDSSEALEFFRQGLIKAPFKIIGLSELQKVYDLMHEGKIAGRYVVDTSK